VLLPKQVIDTGMSSMVKHTPMSISALLAASADQEEQELGLRLQSEWELVIAYGGQYIAIGHCSLQGPFEKSFNLTMYGTASIDGGGSDSSQGTLHVIVREKTKFE